MCGFKQQFVAQKWGDLLFMGLTIFNLFYSCKEILQFSFRTCLACSRLQTVNSVSFQYEPASYSSDSFAQP